MPQAEEDKSDEEKEEAKDEAKDEAELLEAKTGVYLVASKVAYELDCSGDSPGITAGERS